MCHFVGLKEQLAILHRAVVYLRFYLGLGHFACTDKLCVLLARTLCFNGCSTFSKDVWFVQATSTVCSMSTLSVAGSLLMDRWRRMRGTRFAWSWLLLTPAAVELSAGTKILDELLRISWATGTFVLYLSLKYLENVTTVHNFTPLKRDDRNVARVCDSTLLQAKQAVDYRHELSAF